MFETRVTQIAGYQYQLICDDKQGKYNADDNDDRFT